MVAPKRFEDLEGWKKARELVNRVYDMTQQGALAKDFGLRDQMQRAAVSIMSNLAEGFDRTHQAEKLQFYRVARASAGEVRSLLYILSDRQYADAESIQGAQALADELGRIIQGLIRSFQRNSKS
ncbi:MAG: four helix bundle protein [Verrucomicrobia bacterium]|nr:four helix bundle protein [Verrucomicrobiota bacterium]